MLSIKEATVKAAYIYYEGRSTGVDSPHKLSARNIALPGLQPEWRVTEAELHRWMKLKGYRLVDRGYWL
jgi:hypothetical protein